MKSVLIAIDAFKGCLTSTEANASAAEGVLNVFPEVKVVQVPIADGGEGFLFAMQEIFPLKPVSIEVHDPLMRLIEVKYGMLDDTAVIEMAKVNGLLLLAENERDVLKATTYGLGEVLVDAVAKGAKKILLGLGGSATCDGGRGMIEALKEANYLQKKIDVQLFCDVDNPMCGPRGTARVFAPQKGANSDEVAILEKQIIEWADFLKRETGKNIADKLGTGAAGGVSGALYAYWNAKIEKGVDLFLNEIRFDKMAARADLIITGEGRLDAQTFGGKVPIGVLNQSGATPVVGIAGQVQEKQEFLDKGFEEVCSINSDPFLLKEAMKVSVAKERIKTAVSKIVRKYK